MSFDFSLNKRIGPEDVDRLVRLMRETRVSPADLPPQDDEAYLSEYREQLIAGFLNLGKEDGWDVAAPLNLGVTFARFSFNSYFSKNRDKLEVVDRVIFVKALQTFPMKSHSEPVPSSGYHPKTNRSCLDPTIEGWKTHAICRVVGNVGSQYDPSKPFFEILVNSARTSANDPYSKPFTVSIYNNEKELECRQKTLLSFRDDDYNPLISNIFFSTVLTKPNDYLNKSQNKFGPNAIRILDGLTFLNETTLPAQKVGNCWLKQPLRCQLISLYLEILSEQKEMTPEKAWKKALGFYKDIQNHSLPYIRGLLNRVSLTPQMRASAERAIAARIG